MMPTNSKASKDLSILIIDDEPDVRGVVAPLFSDTFKNVYEAENGKVGLELIRKHNPSVIVSDYNMPQLNGLELLKFLRDEEIKTPVIWITGYATRELLRDAWSSGVYDYFEKPFKPETLRASVLGAVEWGKSFNVERGPGFISKIKTRDFKLSIDAKNYDVILQMCEKKGVSLTTLLNHFIEEQVKTYRG